MTSRKRDSYGFKPSKAIKVPGWDARRMARHQGPLDIREIAYRTGLRSAKAIASACRAGQLPRWRFDRMTGRVLWHRLEFEALMFWQRASEYRAARSCPVRAQKYFRPNHLDRRAGVVIEMRR